MQPNGPLDASQIDFSQFGDDDDVELVITEEHGTPSESSPKVEFPYKRNEKFVSLTDHDLDEEIRKHQGYLRTLPLKDTAKLKKKIADFENEKLSRQRKNRSKEQVPFLLPMFEFRSSVTVDSFDGPAGASPLGLAFILPLFSQLAMPLSLLTVLAGGFSRIPPPCLPWRLFGCIIPQSTP